MIRRIRNTFDWEYMVRVLMAAVVLYVAGTVVLHGGSRLGDLGWGAVGQAGR